MFSIEWPRGAPRCYYRIEYVDVANRAKSSVRHDQDDAYDSFTNLAGREGVAHANLFYIVEGVSNDLIASF